MIDEALWAAGVVVMACARENMYATGEACQIGGARSVCRKLNTGDGWFRVWQVADGLVVPVMSGNADGGKEP